MKILGECPACAEPVTESESMKVDGMTFGRGVETGERFWHLECWFAHLQVLGRTEDGFIDLEEL